MKKFYRIFMILLSLTCIFAVSSCDKVKIKNNETENNKSKENTANTEISIRDRVTAEGIVVVNNGSYLIIENGAPIEMHIRGDKSSFEELTTGDVIKIERDSQVMESFPGQVFVYSCEKISDGNVYDIPAELLTTLSELGWVKERDLTEENREIHETVTTEEVSCNYNNFSASLRVPEGWSYEIKNESFYGPGFTITVFPNDGDGDLELTYTDPTYVIFEPTIYDEDTSEEYTLGGLTAIRFHDPDSYYWLSIHAGEGDCIMLSNKLDIDTFQRLRDDVELIVGSVKFEFTTVDE